jgi:hypothetical protein
MYRYDFFTYLIKGKVSKEIYIYIYIYRERERERESVRENRNKLYIYKICFYIYSISIIYIICLYSQYTYSGTLPFHVQFSKISPYKPLGLQLTYLIFLSDFKPSKQISQNVSNGRK